MPPVAPVSIQSCSEQMLLKLLVWGAAQRDSTLGSRSTSGVQPAWPESGTGRAGGSRGETVAVGTSSSLPLRLPSLQHALLLTGPARQPHTPTIQKKSNEQCTGGGVGLYHNQRMPMQPSAWVFCRTFGLPLHRGLINATGLFPWVCTDVVNVDRSWLLECLWGM